MTRVARPGGTIAAAVWDAQRMPLLRAFCVSAADAAPERVAEIDYGRQVGYARPDELGWLFDRAGFQSVATGDRRVTADYESIDDLMRPFAARVGRSGALFVSLDVASQQALIDGVKWRLGSPRGAFTLTAHAWWARGTVSS